MRYKLTIEYDGTDFLGWQKQHQGPSVQEVLEIAVSTLYGRKVQVTGAGRTDVGVHALGQVAHFDAPDKYECFAVTNAINHYLKDFPVGILNTEEVAPDFHARFSAKSRSYLYRILNRKTPPTVDRKRVWHVPAALDVDAMREAATHFLGTHDFTSFRNSMCQAKSPVKTLDVMDVSKIGDEIHINVQARSFLHNQVRIMVGTLFDVGIGRITSSRIDELFELKDRTAAGGTAPACGLYFVKAEY